MNLVTDALHPSDLASLRGIVTGLVRDADAGQSVTWYTPGTRAYSPASGSVTGGDTASAFTAWVGPAEMDEAKGVKAGDVLVLVAMADVASPALDTRFLIGTVPHLVYRVEPSPISSTCTLVYARRVP